MRILLIGLDRNVLRKDSAVAQRQVMYFEGQDVDFVELGTGAKEEASIRQGLRVFTPGGASKLASVWRAFRFARRLFRQNAYDVVTVQDPLWCGWVAWLARGSRATRFYVQDHAALFSRSPVGMKEKVLMPAARWLCRRADRVRTVSERGKRGMMRIGVPEDRIDVVPVAVPLVFGAPQPPARSGHHLVCIARLYEEKGVDILLRAMPHIVHAYPDTRLTVLGEGPARSRLTQLVSDLGISAHVTLAGQQTTVQPFLAEADVYVQPSRYEGWGIAVLEAAAAGVPIVMTDVGCAGEVFQDKRDARIVPTEAPAKLAQAVLEAFASPEESRRMAQHAQDAVRALPEVNELVRRIRASHDAVMRMPIRSDSEGLWRLFVVAFGIRVLLWALILVFVGPKGLELGDSRQYLGLAQSLLDGDGFTFQGLPFFYRTIGYPLFLAGGLFLFRSVAGFVLFQIILASFIPLVVSHLGKRLGLGARASRIAAWLAVLEPHLVFFSVTVMAESVYTLILLLGFIYLFRAIETRKALDSVMSGLAFGVGLLIKPLLTFFPFVVFVVFLPWIRRINLKETLKHACVIFVTIFLLLSPWMYRNYRLFGSFALSNQGSGAALGYLGTSIVSVRDHLAYPDAEAKVLKQFSETYGTSLGERERATAYNREAMRLVKAHPSIVLRLVVINTVTFWTSSNYNSFLNYYHLIPAVDHSVLPPTHYLAQGRIGDLVTSFWKIFLQPFYFIGVLGRVVWTLLFLFFLFGMYTAYRRIPEKRFPLLFFMALCLYLTVTVWVDGLGIEARLRHPLMPVEFLFAAYAWSLMRMKSPRTTSPSLLIITQRVDAQDRNLAVHVRWLKFFSETCTRVHVIAQSVGTYELPGNVRVESLGKERGASKLAQLFRFWRQTWRAVGDSDEIFVLMSPLYVLLVWPIAFLRGKPIYLWYTHKHVPFVLRVAVLLVRNVFSASPESFRLKTSKVRFFGHAIDTDFFASSSVVRDPKRLVTVGRIAASKRIDVMIEAVKKLPSLRLDVIGEPILSEDKIELERLRALVRESGLSDTVRFLGGQTPEQVRSAYQNAAVCINASKTGSLDKALLEAMACGCPVVTSNEAFANIVPEGFVTGEFAPVIQKMLETPTDSAELRRRIVEGHSMRKTLGRILDTMSGS